MGLIVRSDPGWADRQTDGGNLELTLGPRSCRERQHSRFHNLEERTSCKCMGLLVLSVEWRIDCRTDCQRTTNNGDIAELSNHLRWLREHDSQGLKTDWRYKK
jgi:hypothetical protein